MPSNTGRLVFAIMGMIFALSMVYTGIHRMLIAKYWSWPVFFLSLVILGVCLGLAFRSRQNRMAKIFFNSVRLLALSGLILALFVAFQEHRSLCWVCQLIFLLVVILLSWHRQFVAQISKATQIAND